MGEIKQLAVLVTACLIIGVIGIALSIVLPPLFEGDLTVSSYAATLYENGTLTEHYTYDVKTSGEYHMLYRSWEEPLLFTTPAQPSVEIVSAVPPPGTIAYAKDDSGNVAVYGDSSAGAYTSTIGRSAQDDEAGIFSPGSFAAGQYTVAYTYVLYPPIEYRREHDPPQPEVRRAVPHPVSRHYDHGSGRRHPAGICLSADAGHGSVRNHVYLQRRRCGR